MKKSITILLHIIIALGISGCKEGYGNNDFISSFSATPTTFDCTFHEDILRVKIDAENTKWTFLNIPEWVSVDPTEGTGSGTVFIHLSLNMSGDEDRKADIILYPRNPFSKDYEEAIPISITQHHTFPEFKVKETLNFSGETDSQVLAIESNCKWTATTDEEWITLNAADQNLTVSVTENTLSTLRAGYIILHYSTNTKQILVIQTEEKV